MSHIKENKELKDLLRQFMIPIKHTSYPLVMEVITGYPVIEFNPKEASDKKLLRTLEDALRIAISKANKKGIFRSRPNEVGNDIEDFVKDALNNLGLKASIPNNSKGNKQATGYPDILIEEPNERMSYL